MTVSADQRLHDLEARFMGLEEELKDSPEKEAISVLHAMFQESLRNATVHPQPGAWPANGRSMEEVADLYKHAPDMKGDAENSGLEVGIQAPDFSLPDASKRSTRLSDFRGKTVILCFYPLDWSPACSDQLSLYQNELAEFEKANAQLLCVSVDSIYSHGAWATVRGLSFPLLADFHPKGEVAKLYNIWRDSDGFSERALYVIDPEGIIRYKIVAPHLDNIPDIYELLDQLNQPEGSRLRSRAK
jgi:peroxiredoxin